MSRLVLAKCAATLFLGLMNLAAFAQITPLGQTPQGQMIRRFPETAERANFTVKLFPELIVNGRQERLAPGGRIFNEQNLLMTPASITGQKYVVNYTKDSYGLVKDVWILSQEELKLKAPKVLKAEADKAILEQAAPR